MKQEILMQAARELGTPFYLFDLDLMEEWVKQLKEVLGDSVSLCYAMKANPFLIRKAAECIGRIEVCSPGELQICKALEIPMSKVILSGVLKEQSDLTDLFKNEDELPLFTAESFVQAETLCGLAAQYNREAGVLLRLTSGNQFGMDETVLMEAAEKIAGQNKLCLKGIHFYSGTQKKKTEQIKAELEMLDALCVRIKEQTGIAVQKLEYGPGFYVEYFQRGTAAPPEEERAKMKDMLLSVRTAVEHLKFGGNVVFEMGRYFAAACGYYVTAVREVKENLGGRYCLVDGGLHHLNYDGQVMAMKTPFCRQIPEKGDARQEKYNICGALCTVNDVLIKQFLLQDVAPGDLLVFERTGAYSMTEGMSLFLSRDLPAIANYSKRMGIVPLRKQMPIYGLNMENPMRL